MIKIKLISLGCPKNQVDSEFMQGIISENKTCLLVENADQAEVIIINTCGFIDKAKEESIDTIMEAARLKEEGNCKALIVTGCLTQRYQDEIYEQIPEIDALLGAGNYEQIVETIEEVSEEKRVNLVDKPNFNYNAQKPRKLVDDPYIYVKIAEGCNNRCSYCVIPDIRGPVTSRLIEDINQEITEYAVNEQVKEIILVAQDITQYGADRGEETNLEKLLEKILKIDNIPRIRLLYTYPERISDELIALIRDNDIICNYLDLPIQHSSPRIRRLMDRQGSTEKILEKIIKIRNEIPDIALRTSLIVGFPGETEKDFQYLRKFVNKVEFDRLGVFKYSREEGTPAADMEDQVADEIKEKRYNIIMETQQEISRRKNQQREGEILQVVVDEVYPDYAVARSQYEAPEIDNQIIIHDSALKKGDFVKCKIIDSFEYDLIGETIT